MPKVYEDGNIRIEQVSAGRGHKYKVAWNGQDYQYPSVTTLLNRVTAKPGLVSWAERRALAVALAETTRWTGQQIDDELIATINSGVSVELDKPSQESELGTSLHAAVADWVDHGVIATEWEPELTAFRNWLDATGLSVVDCEMPVADTLRGVGGTYDVLAKAGYADDAYVLIDLKRAKGVYPEYALQLGAYSRMLSVTRNIVPAMAFVLQFRTDPESDQILRAHEVIDLSEAQLRWEMACALALKTDGKEMFTEMKED